MESEMVLAIAPEEIDRPAQPRTRSWGDLEQLAASIKTYGQDTPGRVRRKGDRYELVVGERRLRACEMAGVPFLAIVTDLDDAHADTMRARENLMREGLQALERAEAAHAAIVMHGFSAAEWALRVGLSESTVRRDLALLELQEPARSWLAQGLIAGDAALALAQLAHDDQAEVIQSLADDVVRGERITRGHVEDEIRGIIRRLDGVAWDIADATMPGGACSTCPKRSGTQGELFDVVLEDRCFDRSCFAGKLEETWNRKSAAAKKAGLLVLDEARAAKAFEYGSEYVRLDEVAHYLDPKGRPTTRSGEWDQKADRYTNFERVTYRDLLGAEHKPVIAKHPQTHEAVELALAASAKHALATVKMHDAARAERFDEDEESNDAPESSSSKKVQPSESEKAAKEERKLQESARAIGWDLAMAALVAAIEAKADGIETLRAVAAFVREIVHVETLRAVAKRRELPTHDAATGDLVLPKEAIARESATLNAPRLSALICELAATSFRDAFWLEVPGNVAAAIFESRAINVAAYVRDAKRKLRGVETRPAKGGRKKAQAEEVADAGE